MPQTAQHLFTVGDTGRTLTGTCLDGTTSPVNLAGATLEVHIQRPGSGTKIIAPATIVSAAAGTWSRAWVAGDLDVDGIWKCELQVTFSNGIIQTYPSTDPIQFRVRKQIA